MKLEWTTEETDTGHVREVAMRPDQGVMYVINHTKPESFDYQRGIKYVYRVLVKDVHGEWQGNPAETRYYARLGSAKAWAQKDSDQLSGPAVYHIAPEEGDMLTWITTDGINEYYSVHPDGRTRYTIWIHDTQRTRLFHGLSCTLTIEDRKDSDSPWIAREGGVSMHRYQDQAIRMAEEDARMSPDAPQTMEETEAKMNEPVKVVTHTRDGDKYVLTLDQGDRNIATANLHVTHYSYRLTDAKSEASYNYCGEDLHFVVADWFQTEGYGTKDLVTIALPEALDFPENTPEPEAVCGEAYDHTVPEGYSECTECGAEVQTYGDNDDIKEQVFHMWLSVFNANRSAEKATEVIGYLNPNREIIGEVVEYITAQAEWSSGSLAEIYRDAAESLRTLL